MIAYDIMWDTDGEDIELPEEIAIPPHMTDDEEISDYITNISGFCHKGFSLRQATSAGEVLDADWELLEEDYESLSQEEEHYLYSLGITRGCAYTISASGLYHIDKLYGKSKLAIAWANFNLFIMWACRKIAEYFYEEEE